MNETISDMDLQRLENHNESADELAARVKREQIDKIRSEVESATKRRGVRRNIAIQFQFIFILTLNRLLAYSA
jgi:hypothetical protein